jgi:hypothetical protein
MLLQHLDRRDLPMPASPLSSTTCPIPSLTCAQRSSSSPISCSRPTSESAGAASGFQTTASLLSYSRDRPPAAGPGSSAWCLTADRQRSRRAVGRSPRHQGIRGRDALQAPPGWASRPGLLFLPRAASDVTDHHQSGMDTGARPGAPRSCARRILSWPGPRRSQRVPHGRWASSSCARG